MVISVLKLSSNFSSPPVLLLLAIILRAYVSRVRLSSMSTTRPNEPWPRNRSSVKPETLLAYLSLNGVVEQSAGSKRAVLKFDWRQPISLGASRRRRRVCAIGWAALLRLRACRPVPEPERWRGPRALRNGCVRAASAGLAARKGEREMRLASVL